MRTQLSRVILYISLLGTAVASIVNEQQVNLTLLVVLLAFALSIALGEISKLPYRMYFPYLWFVLATVPGTILYLLRGSSVLVPMQQYIGVLVFWVVIWNIFRCQKYSAEKIFLLYLRCAKFAACIGIFQQICYLLDIETMYDLRWVLIGVGDIDVSGSFLRVYSLFTEPSYFAAFLMPALYFSILRIIGASKLVDLKWGLIFIIALFCTFSAIGYIGLILCIIFALRLSFRNILIGVLFVLALLGVASISPVISSRLLSISGVIEDGLRGDENLSVFVNALNLNITKNILSDYPVFGLGIGAYRVYSIPYLEIFVAGDDNLIARVKDQLELFTLTDGGSMYLRLSTELGVAGFLLFIFLMLRGKREQVSRQHRDIAKAALLFIVVFSLRSGQLIRFDFIFFCALYSLVWIQTVNFERRYFRENVLKMEAQ
jgi:hypothetical protein